MRLDVGHMDADGGFKLTPYSVTAYRVAKFLTDGKSRLRRFAVASAKKQHEVFVGYALSVFVHVVVLIVFFKSVLRLQSSLPDYAERE